MNVLNRAIKNLFYRKGKYLLVCLIMSIVGIFLVISINMEESAKTVKQTTLDNINPIGLLFPQNFVKYDPNQIRDLDFEKINEVAESKFVRSATVYHESQSNVFTDEYELGVVSYWAHGTSNLVEFSRGMFEMEEGRFLDENDLTNKERVVVVETRFAEKYGLNLGDTLSLGYMGPNRYEYKIVGIYNNHKTAIANEEIMYPENLIHIPIMSFASDKGSLENPKIDRSTFELWSGLDAKEFLEFTEIYLKGTTLEVDVDLNYFIRVMKPLDVIVGVAKMSKVLSVVTMIVILSILSVLIVKDREYEIGILLAIGESKIKIVLQLLIELLIISLVSLLVSFPIGSTVARENSNRILAQQMEFFPEKEGRLSYSGSTFNFEEYMPVINRDEMLENYEVVSIEYVDDVLLYIIFISFSAVIISSIPVLNKSPKFLLERRA